MELGSVFSFNEYPLGYDFAIANGYTIEEVEPKEEWQEKEVEVFDEEGNVEIKKEKELVLVRYFQIVEIPEPLPPTKEEQQKARQEAYRAEVDPITCHIQRLSDEEQTPEVIAEIASLVEERKAKVEEIKARYPYPVEENTPADESDQASDQVDDKLSPVDTVNNNVSELEK